MGMFSHTYIIVGENISLEKCIFAYFRFLSAKLFPVLNEIVNHGNK